MKNKLVTLLVLILIVIFGFALLQGVLFKCRLPIFKSFFGCPATNELPGTSNSPAARAPSPAPAKIVLPKILYNLAGSIKSLEKSAVILDAYIPYLDENGDPAKKNEIKKALVTSDTRITRLTFVAEPGSDRRSPQENPVGFSELKIGDSIEVVSNQDITDKAEFDAILIRILQTGF